MKEPLLRFSSMFQLYGLLMQFFSELTSAWRVSHAQVKSADVVRFPNVRYPDGTEAAVLGLRFRVEARHFSDSDGLRLKCTAIQTRVVALSSEETVQGAHQRSSGFHVAADDATSRKYKPTLSTTCTTGVLRRSVTRARALCQGLPTFRTCRHCCSSRSPTTVQRSANLFC